MSLDRFSHTVGRFTASRPWTIVLITAIVTLGFGAALATIPAVPSNDSFEGDFEASRAEDRIEQYLPPTGFAIPFLAIGSEENGGNILSRAAFDEILRQEERLRADPTVAPLLFTYTSPVLQSEISSVWSLPDTLRAVMDNETPLTYAVGWHEQMGGPGKSYAEATDAEWQDALTRVLIFEPRAGEQPFRRQVSDDARQVDGEWFAHSMFVVPSTHYQRTFESYTRAPDAATAERPLFEDLQFHVQDTLKADARETDYVGLGIGINTEVAREVAESGRLVVVSFILIGLFLFITLRNLRDWLVAYLSLPILITWMLGGARLLGLSINQFTAMLPVLILALGVDFAIHGVRRYREERGHHGPREAVTRSVGLLGPALILAAGTTSTAFLSNAFSDVDALADWGIEGGIAILAGLWICGVFAPALRYLWDRHRVAKGRVSEDHRESRVLQRLERGTLLGRIAQASGARPVAVIVVLALITIPAAFAAANISSGFNADDFLAEDSELIRGTKMVQQDFSSEGEPAIMLLEGDIARPEVFVAVADTYQKMEEQGYRPARDFSLLRVVQTMMQYPEDNGIHYSDRNGDHIPDTRPELEHLLGKALQNGVYARVPLPTIPPPEVAPGVPMPGLLVPSYPDSQRVLVYSADTVRELVHPDGRGGYDMTVLYFGIPGTDDFSVIDQALVDLETSAAGLYALEGGPLEAITLTGEPFKRHAMVNAITDSLQISITFSIVICFLIVLGVFRSLRYAVVTTLPVVVLVIWLFAFMVAIDLSLNLVTVTVAAMAIGVGIDYSIHITERYREEVHKNHRLPLAALRRSMDSSGVALLGSAITTISGFLVLTFAPMPLFATFGLITAAMAAASFLAAATILPPLLVLVERKRVRRPRIRPDVARPLEDAPVPAPLPER